MAEALRALSLRLPPPLTMPCPLRRPFRAAGAPALVLTIVPSGIVRRLHNRASHGEEDVECDRGA